MTEFVGDGPIPSDLDVIAGNDHERGVDRAAAIGGEGHAGEPDRGGIDGGDVEFAGEGGARDEPHDDVCIRAGDGDAQPGDESPLRGGFGQPAQVLLGRGPEHLDLRIPHPARQHGAASRTRYWMFLPSKSSTSGTPMRRG